MGMASVCGPQLIINHCLHVRTRGGGVPGAASVHDALRAWSAIRWALTTLMWEQGWKH